MDKGKKKLLYEKVADYIQELINSQQLKSGYRLPPELDMAKKFRVSQKPVRRAIQHLVERGVLKHVYGKGALVQQGHQGKKETNKIGVLYCVNDTSFFSASFYTAIFGGVQLQADKEKKQLILRSFRRDESRDPNRVIEELTDKVDGFIIIEVFPDILERIKGTLKKSTKPVILVNYEGSLDDIDTIVTDNQTGTKKMIQFLIDNGHRRIACVSHQGRFNPELPASIKMRIQAYQEALADNNIETDHDLIINIAAQGFVLTKINYTEIDEKYVSDFKKVFEIPRPPTAFYCTADETAIFIYKLAKRLNLAIPDTISVVGYDDIMECNAVIPALTTVHTPLVEMGTTSVQRLLQKQEELTQGIHNTQKIVLSTNIAMRESHTSPIGLNSTAQNSPV